MSVVCAVAPLVVAQQLLLPPLVLLRSSLFLARV